MGKGDKKTRKGKIYASSHGNTRPHSPKSKAVVKKTTTVARKVVRPAVKKAAVKKAAPKKSA